MKTVPFIQLSIGNELLYGSVVNSNAREIAAWLVPRGFNPRRIEMVNDELPAVRAALSRAGREARLVILTGGLGSTADDLTRQAVAAYCRVPLQYHPELFRLIRRRVLGRGLPLLDNHSRQAYLPAGARAIANPCGSAPGFYLDQGRLLIISLPGVPREVLAMLPRVGRLLSRRFGRRAGPKQVLRFYGLTESALAARVERLTACRGLPIEYRVDMPEILLTLRGGGARVRAAVRALRRELAETYYGTGTAPLSQRLLALLRRRRQTLAIAESCTGGLLGATLTAIPGSSRSFIGGVIGYANTAKCRGLRVAPRLIAGQGAISKEVALAMARGARRRFGATYALAITGVAGPGGGSRQKPVGTVHLALAGPRCVIQVRHFFRGDRQQIRHRAAFAAQHLLYSYLSGRLPVNQAPGVADKHRQIR